jgi:hypothetical protein
METISRSEKLELADPVGDYGDIKILSCKRKDSIIEILATASDKNGPIGFGTEGRVEIERFRFFNPPTLIDDPK